MLDAEESSPIQNPVPRSLSAHVCIAKGICSFPQKLFLDNFFVAPHTKRLAERVAQNQSLLGRKAVPTQHRR